MDLTLDQKMTLILVFIGIITFILTIVKIFYPGFFERKKSIAHRSARRETKKVTKIKYEDQKVKDKRYKKKISKRVITIEKEIILEPDEYYSESLGDLHEGDTISGNCFETQHENFSYYILNKMNKLNYDQTDKIVNPLCSKKNVEKAAINCTVKHDDHFYILFTHLAKVKPRNIKFELEIVKYNI